MSIVDTAPLNVDKAAPERWNNRQQAASLPPARAGFHLMAKPSGPACNLDCTYCFYLDKEALFDRKAKRRMTPQVLEAYVRQTIAATPAGHPVAFTWQGGEPTLLGLDFYRRAITLQQKYGAGRIIENSFQTNGTLIDAGWADFLATNRFLVGLSLDGPAHIHDRYRRYANGQPSHAKVLAAWEALNAAGAEVNVLACVDAHSSQYPLEVYRYLRGIGAQFIQFTPVVERVAGAADKARGFDLNGPGEAGDAPVADFSVTPKGWGQFLATVFEEWRLSDIGRAFVMNFEWTLASHLGAPGVVCHHQKECGRALIVEHDGAVYNCDHFAYPEYRLGDLARDSLAAMVDSTAAAHFGAAKHESLPAQCRRCPHLESCWGGCPKHRFTTSQDGEPGLNYLCAGYMHYLDAVLPWMAALGRVIRAGGNPAAISAMATPH